MNHQPSTFVLALALSGFWGLAHSAESAAHNDMDGDGRSDLIWRDADTGTIVYWSGASSARATTVRITKGYNLPDDFALSRMIVNVSYGYWGDPRTHLVAQDNTGRYFDLGFNYDLGYGCTAYELMVLPVDWSMVGTGDFNADGEEEFVFRNQSDGRNMISHWGWDSRLEQRLATVANLAWNIVATGDFDGDGIADLLWRNSTTGQNAIWRSANAATPIPMTAVSNLAWKIAAVGDFNGDGRSDIFWRNASTGANVIWNSGSSTTQRAVASVTNFSWNITTTGDYDGDGRTDLFWRNAGSGANAIWKSANAATQQAVTSVSNQAWQTVK